MLRRTMFQERRIYPRIPCDLPAELEIATGELSDVRIVNISQNGFYVEGSTALAGLQPPAGPGSKEVWLHFGLAASALHCHCRIIYKRRNAHDLIGLGLHLVSTDEQALLQIQGYVGEHI